MQAHLCAETLNLRCLLPALRLHLIYAKTGHVEYSRAADFSTGSLFETTSPVKNDNLQKFASGASEQCSETDVQPRIEVKHRCEHQPTCKHEDMRILYTSTAHNTEKLGPRKL